jgi:hypothetical protein
MKRFVIKTLFYLLLFYITYGIYCVANNYISGDLGKLGGIPFGKKYNQDLEKNYLTKKLTIDTLINLNHQQKLRFGNNVILTIGDSFSGLGIFGYPNYLATLSGYDIVNIKRRNNLDPDPTNPVNLDPVIRTISFLNNNSIDSIACKIVIIETVDRNAISRLANADFEQNDSIGISKTLQKRKINKANTSLYKLCSWIRLQFNYDNSVLKYQLKGDYFTHKFFSNQLFCFQDDFVFKRTTKREIEQAEKNLFLLNKKFSEKGIKLIFLIAADKYDVYRPFLKDDSLPIDTTTDGLSMLPDVCVINTKPLLQSMVQKGIKDVFLVNDSHWSYKASEKVAQEIYEKICSITN